MSRRLWIVSVMVVVGATVAVVAGRSGVARGDRTLACIADYPGQSLCLDWDADGNFDQEIPGAIGGVGGDRCSFGFTRRPDGGGIPWAEGARAHFRFVDHTKGIVVRAAVSGSVSPVPRVGPGLSQRWLPQECVCTVRMPDGNAYVADYVECYSAQGAWGIGDCGVRRDPLAYPKGPHRPLVRQGHGELFLLEVWCEDMSRHLRWVGPVT